MAVNAIGSDMKAFLATNLLVSYPSRRAFSAMVRDPAYQEGAHLRTEAVTEAVLQPTTPH